MSHIFVGGHCASNTSECGAGSGDSPDPVPVLCSVVAVAGGGAIAYVTPFRHAELERQSMAHIAIFPVMSGRQAGGPETYEGELIRNLARLDAENEYSVFCLGEAAASALRVEKANFRFHVLRPSVRAISMSLTLPWQLALRRVDFLHAAYIAPPFSPVPYAFTLHCSSPFMRPEVFPPMIRARLRALIWHGMRTGRHVICVSQNVLDLAAERYGTPRERMSVVYNGVGEHFRPVPEPARRAALARAGIDGPYALFVGRFEPRKNMLRVIESFDVYRREVAPGTRLVLAGRKTWQGDAIDIIGITRHPAARQHLQHGLGQSAHVSLTFECNHPFDRRQHLARARRDQRLQLLRDR